jgi:hypothetical protein
MTLDVDQHPELAAEYKVRLARLAIGHSHKILIL